MNRVAAILSATLLLALPLAAQAQQVPAATSAPAKSAVTVDGFRSAKYGMTEAQVRSAIEKDFNLKGGDVAESEDTTAETQVLTIEPPELLPKGGKAKVAYIFGMKSHKLMQVTILWSTEADSSVTPAVLVSDANILQNYFRTQGYVANSVQMNMALNASSILYFRGLDAAGHMTLLVLNGTLAKDANGAQKLTPAELMVSYAADPQDPDVFKLAPGQF